MHNFACSLLLKALLVKKGEGGHLYINSVTVRFCFDVLEPGKFELFVKNKATETLYGMFIFCLELFLCLMV